MEIRSLENIGFDTLFNAFERAFADYEIRFEKEEVRRMLTRRGYVPRLSFGAFDNGAIIAFTLNGIGMFNGVSTAYDTGTGTVKEYRGQGIAEKYSIILFHILKRPVSCNICWRCCRTTLKPFPSIVGCSSRPLGSLTVIGRLLIKSADTRLLTTNA